jgi:CubicO group peptidase (beta-lactamase class C family)
MMAAKYCLFLLTYLLLACNTPDELLADKSESLPGRKYFPPVGSTDWLTTTPDKLGWDQTKLDELYSLLDKNGTRAFIILKGGKIVVEEYFGRDLLKIRKFDKDKQWYWASAGKTLTAFMVGMAQEEGFLKIDDKTSDYLGNGWTSLPRNKEDLITVRHQLTMTSGLDDSDRSSTGFAPEDLTYKADAGTRWAYHNGPYTLLEKVVSAATNKSFDTYFDQKLAQKIGMDGSWRWVGNFHLYFSTARSMARFGLLMLNNGNWDGQPVLRDSLFLQQMMSPSQGLNESYGYLWWLNGKESFMLPQSQLVFKGSIIPNAPTDMVMGLGKNGQYVCVIPSLDMVMVRMGENPENSDIAALFLRTIWEKLNQAIP